MAGYGPPPNPTRRQRGAPSFTDVQIHATADRRVRGPRPDPDWSPAVRDWYETWRRAPQAQAFQATDWQRLRMLAPLVEQYFRDPKSTLMDTIVRSESLLGATHVDRLRARIKVEQPAASESAPDPAHGERQASRRSRLTSVAS